MRTRWSILRVVFLAIVLGLGVIVTYAVNGNLDFAADVAVETGDGLGDASVVDAPVSADARRELNVDPQDRVDEFVAYGSSLLDDTTPYFGVTAEILPDRSAYVVEEIHQLFSVDRHGIYRTIPLVDKAGRHLITALRVSTSDGTPDDVELTSLANGIEIRIGDPDVWISGLHKYRIEYIVENVVFAEDGVERVALDALTDWNQTVGRLDYRIVGPGAPTAVRCFQGRLDSNSSCAVATELSDGGLFSSESDPDDLIGLAAGEAFTAEVDFPAGTFEVGAASSFDDPRGLWPWLVAIHGLVLLLAFGNTVRQQRRLRAEGVAELGSTFDEPQHGSLPGRRDSSTAGPTPAFGGPAAIEFVPPLNLDPVSMLRIIELGHARIGRMLAATLADLASDGIVEIGRDDDEVKVRAISQPPRRVTEYELLLLRAIFPAYDNQATEQPWVTLSDRRDEIAAVARQFRVAVDGNLRNLGLLRGITLSSDEGGIPNKIRRYGVLVFLILLASAMPAVLLSGGSTLAMLLPGAIVAVFLLGGSHFWKRRWIEYTPRGKAARLRAEGFRRFMRDSEALHARAAERLGLVREYAGYAVAFESIDELAAAMPNDAGLMTAFGGAATLGLLGRSHVWRPSIVTSNPQAAARSLVIRGGGVGGGSAGGGAGGGGGGSW
jgi:hypothetical protein